jgi:hypothetical protein
MGRKGVVLAVRVGAAALVIAIAIAFQFSPGNVLRISAQYTYVPFPFPFPVPFGFPVTPPPTYLPPYGQPLTQVAAVPACTTAISAVNSVPLVNCPTTVVNQPVTTVASTNTPPSCTPMTDGQGGWTLPAGCPTPTFPPDPNAVSASCQTGQPVSITESTNNPVTVTLSESNASNCRDPLSLTAQINIDPSLTVTIGNATTGTATFSGNQITWTGISLSAGQQATLTFSATKSGTPAASSPAIQGGTLRGSDAAGASISEQVPSGGPTLGSL